MGIVNNNGEILEALKESCKDDETVKTLIEIIKKQEQTLDLFIGAATKKGIQNRAIAFCKLMDVKLLVDSLAE